MSGAHSHASLCSLLSKPQSKFIEAEIEHLAIGLMLLAEVCSQNVRCIVLKLKNRSKVREGTAARGDNVTQVSVERAPDAHNLPTRTNVNVHVESLGLGLSMFKALFTGSTFLSGCGRGSLKAGAHRSPPAPGYLGFEN